MSKSMFQTATGDAVDLALPDLERISIQDIGFALSRVCRFGGHISPALALYSIAQHSVIVSRLCPPEMALIGLLHDAPEAFLGDVVSPLKCLLSAYHDLENKWALAIGQRFGLGDALANLPLEVKVADQIAFQTERRDILAPLMPGAPNPFAHFDRQIGLGGPGPMMGKITAIENPFLAHKLFLDEFQKLSSRVVTVSHTPFKSHKEESDFWKSTRSADSPDEGWTEEKYVQGPDRKT